MWFLSFSPSVVFFFQRRRAQWTVRGLLICSRVLTAPHGSTQRISSTITSNQSINNCWVESIGHYSKYTSLHGTGYIEYSTMHPTLSRFKMGCHMGQTKSTFFIVEVIWILVSEDGILIGVRPWAADNWAGPLSCVANTLTEMSACPWAHSRAWLTGRDPVN